MKPGLLPVVVVPSLVMMVGLMQIIPNIEDKVEKEIQKDDKTINFNISDFRPFRSGSGVDGANFR